MITSPWRASVDYPLAFGQATKSAPRAGQPARPCQGGPARSGPRAGWPGRPAGQACWIAPPGGRAGLGPSSMKTSSCS